MYKRVKKPGKSGTGLRLNMNRSTKSFAAVTSGPMINLCTTRTRFGWARLRLENTIAQGKWGSTERRVSIFAEAVSQMELAHCNVFHSLWMFTELFAMILLQWTFRNGDPGRLYGRWF